MRSLEPNEEFAPCINKKIKEERQTSTTVLCPAERIEAISHREKKFDSDSGSGCS